MSWTYTINPVSVRPPVPELDPVEGVLFTIVDDDSDEIVATGMARNVEDVAGMAAAELLCSVLQRASIALARRGLCAPLVAEISAALDQASGVTP